MRHSYPEAVTLVFSGYPELKEAMSAILMQADEVLVKPLNIPKLVELIREKLLHRTPEFPRATETVATILENDCTATIQNWLARVDGSPPGSGARAARLRAAYRPPASPVRGTRGTAAPATKPGRQTLDLPGGRRTRQDTAPAGLHRRHDGEESRMLQVSIFQTLQNNLPRVDFSLLLVDVMTIADEVDWQLTQAMRSYMEQVAQEAAA